MTRIASIDKIDLAGLIRPGDTIVWGQGAAEPTPLTRALAAQRHAIAGRFKVFLGFSHSSSMRAEFSDCIDFAAYCGTGSNRALGLTATADVLPCHYSAFPRLMRAGRLKADVLMLQVAPADDTGRYSFSIAHEYLIAALESARIVIAEVNEQAPWTHGERYLLEEDFDVIVHTSRPPVTAAQQALSEIDRAVAARAARLIDDGATLQIGMGKLPQAIVMELGDRRDLGVHSGMIGDAVAALMEREVITNRRKTIDFGVTVTGILDGSERLLRFAHRNPRVQLRPTEYTHDPRVLASIERFVAINSAVEVDLTGQINSEVAGGNYVGAVGGAIDFARAAQFSQGGLAIVVLPSMVGYTSRIVPRLSGPVSVPRSDAGVVVTEHGIADLRHASLRERVRRMISIAHPQTRADLERAAEECS